MILFNVPRNKHNNSSYGKHRFTATVQDWEEFLVIPCRDYPHAVRIEKHIKKMKSRKYIENIRKYPELLEKLIKINQ